MSEARSLALITTAIVVRPFALDKDAGRGVTVNNVAMHLYTSL